MSFILPDLSFSYDALEPYIDEQTMEIHHSRHHAGYTKKFNAAIEESGLEDKTPEEIFSRISKYSDAVRNNGGGFYNHNLFWNFLSPAKQEIEDQDLKDTLTKYFGSVEDFKNDFSSAAAKRFGSGWAWLIKKNNGELMITSTPNQDNPLMDIISFQGRPLLCLDVWEHAYYLKYQNKRQDYIEAFWNVVNWEYVTEQFKK